MVDNYVPCGLVMMGRCWPQSMMRYEIGKEEPHSINCCRNSPLIFTEVEKTLAIQFGLQIRCTTIAPLMK